MERVRMRHCPEMIRERHKKRAILDSRIAQLIQFNSRNLFQFFDKFIRYLKANPKLPFNSARADMRRHVNVRMLPEILELKRFLLEYIKCSSLPCHC
jgi:hypothetical protein